MSCCLIHILALVWGSIVQIISHSKFNFETIFRCIIKLNLFCSMAFLNRVFEVHKNSRTYIINWTTLCAFSIPASFLRYTKKNRTHVINWNTWCTSFNSIFLFVLLTKISEKQGPDWIKIGVCSDCSPGDTDSRSTWVVFLWTTNWGRIRKTKNPARLVELELERSKGACWAVIGWGLKWFHSCEGDGLWTC